jgi:hypothetical protein
MTKTIAQMTAEEYKQFLLNNPDEVKKLDETLPQTGTAVTGTWRNGVWIPAVALSPEQPQ